jgi:hypothetical protein
MEARKSLACIGLTLFGISQIDAAHASDVNYTGPLLTPNAGILPRGLVNIEPYLVYSSSRYYYDNEGNKHRQNRSAQWQTLVPITAGFTERFGMQATLGATRNSVQGGNHSDGMRVTDTSLRAQFLLLRPSADGLRPALSISAIHRFPTGRYDHLDNNPLNGTGSGVHGDRVDMLIQQSLPMPNGRPLRWRGRLAYDFNPGAVDIRGRSVYGTDAGFRGRADLSHAWSASASVEYSIDAHWVLAMDLAFQRGSSTRVYGSMPVAGREVAVDRPGSISRNVSIAPAIEYNVNGNLGIVAGVHMSVAGRNSDAFVAPQAAVNMVF